MSQTIPDPMDGVPPGTLAVDRTLTQAEFDRFARLSGDDNPIHVDPVFSAGTRFGRTVAHGVFLTSILRGLAERLLPGAAQVAQDLRFPAPTYAGEAMRFQVRLGRRAEGVVDVDCTVTRLADNTVTCDGTLTLAAGLDLDAAPDADTEAEMRHADW
ncbi:MAG: hypothetical protein RLY86_1590 [Pseudomonadota bacterium]|jgi:acyl dehydratase